MGGDGVGDSRGLADGEGEKGGGVVEGTGGGGEGDGITVGGGEG